ncbi:hypothetical protein [Novacetimonas pomaceti]|uniref:hypothetical protein n=1 Tax=Novacetimonas pomaceti TaxID=2021998 RepID=UPI001C2D3A1E|nr:hypothetical protein [Novacetimonas pomaceti]MBV1833832.1 hypothetical protein [Novacetimonas pomaceti]
MSGQAERIVNVGVAAHLMLLEPGTFCVFHAPGPAHRKTDGGTGLSGVRVTRAPSDPDAAVMIRALDDDGWLGPDRGAALIRVDGRPARVLVTTYHDPARPETRPNLQVARLYVPANPTAPSFPPAAPVPPAATAAITPAPAVGGVIAHIQRRGDVRVPCGAWMGKVGSRAWIEGFSILPDDTIPANEIEYQAVLGQGWFSPWVEGGSYCGSRGMALPLLGLRVHLRGEAAEKFTCRLTATFVDGSRVGPVEDIAAMSDDLAPLEAFMVEITPRAPQPEDAGKAVADTREVLELLDATDAPATAKAPVAERPRSTRRKKPPAKATASGPARVETPPRASDAGMPPRKTAAAKDGTRKRNARKNAKTETDPASLTPDEIHPGRGRKAPGSRVALLKARRKATARRRD